MYRFNSTEWKSFLLFKSYVEEACVLTKPTSVIRPQIMKNRSQFRYELSRNSIWL